METTEEKSEKQVKEIKGSLKKSEFKNFKKADEVRNFPNGRLEIISIGGKSIGRATLNPGWKWSSSIKEIAHTDSCEAPHFQYHVSGVLKVKMNNGEEYELHAGDFSMIAPGHDAWVVGNEAVVLVDFLGMAEFAKNKLIQ